MQAYVTFLYFNLSSHSSSYPLISCFCIAGQSTAAGKIQPAKVLVVGAGVAGLAAIQLAKKKGIAFVFSAHFAWL